MMLGDLGAEVIKVERQGTETRPGWGPPFDERGESAYYLSVNRNKKSVVADLDREADRTMILDLARGADVVVDNFRRGTLEKRGIDPETLLVRTRVSSGAPSPALDPERPTRLRPGGSGGERVDVHHR
jgi:crotonobetainyl-CoA:carnitine CoA-transferase CaiB-like acyl-CoA transferase